MQRLRFGENCNLVVFGDSTGDSTTEWVYLLASKIALSFPAFTVQYRAWNSGTNVYNAATTIQTGAGSPPVFTVWNASIAGSLPTRLLGQHFAEALTPAAMGQDPDCVVLSYGHNGGSELGRQYPMEATLASEITRALPFVPILLVGQNPVTSDATMAPKVQSFKALAEANGYGFLDVHAFFKTTLNPLGDYYIDTVHPDANGSEAWATFVHTAFQYEPGVAAGVGASRLNRGVLLAQDSWAAFRNWSKSTGLTVERDTTHFETNGEGVKLTGANLGSGDFFQFDVITSADIKAFRGRWVSFTARVEVPSGSNIDAGRVALFDGTTTQLTANGGPQGTAFYTQAVTMKVGAAATFLRGIIYLSTSAGTADHIYVDRITVSDGPHPMDAVTLKHIDDAEILNLLGSRSNGLMVCRNNANGGRLIQILDTTTGTDQDDPATQYVFTIASDGIRGKARSDTHDRIQFNGITGTFFFGLGNATPVIQLSCGGAGLLRVIDADFYAHVTDGTRSLGLSNRHWSVGYFKRISMDGVIDVPGNGSPEGVVTAPVGSTYRRKDGGAGTSFYVKESGTGNTGWVAK